MFSDDGITEEDLRAGRYDFAKVRMFLVNYEDLGEGVLKLRRGWLGEVTIRDGMYVACAADLGDARCGVDLSALEEIGTVDAVTSATGFATTLVQATGWYDGRELAWTGGANAGQTVAVRSWDAGTSMLTLFLPALYPMQAGDAFTIRPGCDKSFATCRAKFDNVVNFRGFPHVPGTDPMPRVETDEILAAARTRFGTPWRHQGRLRGVAVDCGGLILGVVREVGLLDFDTRAYGRIPDGQQLRTLCEQHLLVKPVADVAPSDVLLMRFTRHPQHLAIVGDRGEPFSLIHAYMPRRQPASTQALDAGFGSASWPSCSACSA